MVHAGVEGHGVVPLAVHGDDQARHLLVHFLRGLNPEGGEQVNNRKAERFILNKIPALITRIGVGLQINSK